MIFVKDINDVAWDRILEYHLTQLTEYITFFEECKRRNVEVPVFQQRLVDGYLREEVPNSLLYSRGRANVSLVERCDTLLEEARCRLYPLRVL